MAEVTNYSLNLRSRVWFLHFDAKRILEKARGEEARGLGPLGGTERKCSTWPMRDIIHKRAKKESRLLKSSSTGGRDCSKLLDYCLGITGCHA